MQRILGFLVILTVLSVNVKGLVSEQDRVRLRIQRSAEDENRMDAIIIDDLGMEHYVHLNPRSRHMFNAHDFPVVTNNGNKWNYQEAVTEIREEGDFLIATRKQNLPDSEMGKVISWFDEGEYTDKDLGIPSRARRNVPSNIATDFKHLSGKVDEIMSRKRRGSGQLDAVVDLLVLVDNVLYKETMEEFNQDPRQATNALKKYYNIVVNLVDLRYSKIESPDLGIRVRLAGMYIAEEREASPWTEFLIRWHKDQMVVDPNEALDALHEWVEDEIDNLPKHDHAMAFTGYPLISHEGGTASGMAYVGTTCQKDGYACSLVHEGGGLSSVGTAVHELGHSLGARHDGEPENADCPATRNHVMAAGNSGSSDVRVNFFSFSRCSVREFIKYISTEKGECLFDSQPNDLVLGKNLPGLIYTPDRQCKEMFGPKSALCKLTIGAPEDICHSVWCEKPQDSNSCMTRSTLSAVLGTPCGKNKVCMLGRCVDQAEVNEYQNNPPRPAPPKPRPHSNAAPSCARDTNEGYCRQLLYTSPRSCDRADIRQYCCWSCGYLLRQRH